jgi:hypothetical protein
LISKNLQARISTKEAGLTILFSKRYIDPIPPDHCFDMKAEEGAHMAHDQNRVYTRMYYVLFELYRAVNTRTKSGHQKSPCTAAYPTGKELANAKSHHARGQTNFTAKKA